MPARSLPVQYPDLATYFEESGDTQANLARELDIPQASVSRYAAGKQLPRPDIARRIAAYAHIPLASFYRCAARQPKRKAS